MNKESNKEVHIKVRLSEEENEELKRCAGACGMSQSEFVERFLELSLFYGLSSPLNSEMICIFPYF